MRAERWKHWIPCQMLHSKGEDCSNHTTMCQLSAIDFNERVSDTKKMGQRMYR